MVAARENDCAAAICEAVLLPSCRFDRSGYRLAIPLPAVPCAGFIEARSATTARPDPVSSVSYPLKSNAAGNRCLEHFLAGLTAGRRLIGSRRTLCPLSLSLSQIEMYKSTGLPKHPNKTSAAGNSCNSPVSARPRASALSRQPGRRVRLQERSPTSLPGPDRTRPIQRWRQSPDWAESPKQGMPARSLFVA